MPHIRSLGPFAILLLTATIFAAPGPCLAKGGGHGSSGGSGGGHAGGGKAHLSGNAVNPKPGAIRDSGDTKGSGDTKAVNASAKPDTDTAATTRPPARKKR